MDMTPYWRWRSEGNFWESVLAFYLLRQGFSWFLPHSKLTKVRVIVLTPLLHRSTEFIDVSHFVQLLLVIPLGMRANKLSSSDWSKETLTYQDILLAVCIILNWFFYKIYSDYSPPLSNPPRSSLPSYPPFFIYHFKTNKKNNSKTRNRPKLWKDMKLETENI